MKKVDTKNLAEVLLENENLSMKDFVAFLARNKMLKNVDEIIAQYEILYNKKHNIIEATFTLTNYLPEKTKHELSEALKKKYQATEVNVQEKIDKKIIGGIKIKIGDTVLDNTLSNSLYQLETQLLK